MPKSTPLPIRPRRGPLEELLLDRFLPTPRPKRMVTYLISSTTTVAEEGNGASPSTPMPRIRVLSPNFRGHSPIHLSFGRPKSSPTRRSPIRTLPQAFPSSPPSTPRRCYVNCFSLLPSRRAAPTSEVSIQSLHYPGFDVFKDALIAAHAHLSVPIDGRQEDLDIEQNQEALSQQEEEKENLALRSF
ncbi:hypothetical protein B0H10DRAFT_1970398 [Mycena sp. CBHHK59/15]|nr:hypothetical protein B0H10DRAFT_1970398 [Mycena sp. CBHHK59/15]